MDYFLKKYSTPKDREGRVKDFFNELQNKFSKKDFEIELEIGCGHGHWLNAYSDSFPDKICIGIDLITKRILKSNLKKQKSENQNLSFLKTSAVDFLDYKPKNIKISKTFIFFPDPWPKKKHHKRRLIQLSFLKTLRSHSTKDGQLFFRTDHDDYFNWSKNIFEMSRHWELENTDFPFEHESYFQNLLPDFQSFSAKVL